MNHLRSTAAHHSSRSGGRHSSLGIAPDYGGYGKSSSLIHRTPSTSAIYETLRRSKELRESINSRPSSRMSLRDTVRHTVERYQSRGYIKICTTLYVSR